MTGDLEKVWRSGEPARIARALAELRTILPPRPPVSAPEAQVLDAFGPVTPPEVVRDFMWVVGNYSSLVPELDAGEVVRRWVDAVVRTGDGGAALQVALALGHEDLPSGATINDVLELVVARQVRSGREKTGAELLARYLLDQPETYDRAVEALKAWRKVPELAEVLDRLWPYVEVEDRSRLGL